MIEIQAPQPTTRIETSRGRKPSDEPNPFIDNEWLWQNYEAVMAHEGTAAEIADTLTQSVTVAGGWESRQATNKSGDLLVDAETGDPIMREALIGDAAKVVSLIRKAADAHNIGVSVQAVPATNDRGKIIKGMVEVKFLAKERKTKRASKGENADTDADA